MTTKESIYVGVLVGIGGALLPGCCAYVLTKSDLLTAWTVTAPVVFAVATVVLFAMLIRFQRFSQYACLGAAVFGLSFGFCELGVRTGALIVRTVLPTPPGGNLQTTSFGDLIAAHYTVSGIGFLGLAAALGGWSSLVPSDPTSCDVFQKRAAWEQSGPTS